MVYRKNHPVAECLNAWQQERSRRSGKEKTGVKSVSNVSAVAWGLGFGEHPEALPENALQLYTQWRAEAGEKALSESSRQSYRSALDQWRRYLDHGHIDLSRPAMTGKAIQAETSDEDDEPLSHPALDTWRRKLRAGFKAQSTITGYLRIVQGMMDVAKKDNPLDLNEDDVEVFIVSRMRHYERIGRTISVSRHDVYLAAVRSCFQLNKQARNDPTFEIKRLRRRDSSAKTPCAAPEAVMRLHAAAAADMAAVHDPQRVEIGRRMWALTALMSGMGFRISTAARIYPRGDLSSDGAKHWLTPRFLKGARGRPKAPHAVPEHMLHEFLTHWQTGESVVPIEWSTVNAGERWKAWAESHGINGLRPHMLRAYYIEEAYQRTGDIHGVSVSADHRDIQTTVGYTNRRARAETIDQLRKFNNDMPCREGGWLPAPRSAEHDNTGSVVRLLIPRPVPAG